MRSISLCAIARSAAARGRQRLVCVGVALACVASSAGAAPARADEAMQRVLALERDGRAQPMQATAALTRLLAEDGVDTATRLSALTVQSMLFTRASDDAAAEGAARQLDELDRSQALPLAGASASLVRAWQASLNGDLRRASSLIDAAMARLPADATPLTRLRFITVQSNVLPEAGKLTDAIRVGHEALALADAVAEPWRQAESRVTLAFNYFKAKQYEQALRLNAEALTVATRSGEPQTLSRVHSMQGIICSGTGDIDCERRAVYAALDLARAAHSKYDETVCLANLADFHLNNGDYALALRFAQQVLPLARELKSRAGETVSLSNIGFALIALHDIEAGKRSVRQAIAIDEGRGAIVSVAEAYGDMGKYLEKAGDLRGAVEALHQHRRLADQLLQRSQQQAILEMQEEFDAERRTRELAQLQRDSTLKSEQLQARERQQRAWWLLAASGLASLAVVAWLARRVRRTNGELTRSNALLKTQGEIDPLTGLANRRSLQVAMRRLAADGTLRGAVLLADIDHFKRINDQWGHAAGDAVLVEVARRLRSVIGEGELIVRWGGEEFLAVVPTLAPAAAQALAQRILNAVGGAPVRHAGQDIAVTVSLGFAVFPLEAVGLAALWPQALNLVDAALYLAKARGRNRACGVQRVHANNAEQLDAISSDLEAACRAGDVSLSGLPGPTSADDRMHTPPLPAI